MVVDALTLPLIIRTPHSQLGQENKTFRLTIMNSQLLKSFQKYACALPREAV
jgi:hypothetical protein